MALDIAGLVTVAIFYLAIVIVGFLATRYIKLPNNDNSAEMAMVAGRNLGLVVGVLTMAATSVGGGYLSGTSESVATPGFGLAWTVFPVTIVIAFTIGSLVFAKPMRRRQYLTVLDPLQERFGDVMTGLLLLGVLFAEIMWGASILIALGTSLSVIVQLQRNWSIIISAVVALVYTGFGKMVSVAYTDLLQLALVAFGMFLCVPFVMTNELIGDLDSTKDLWLGSVPDKSWPSYIDYIVAQIFGGIPWNTYMMRLLSMRSVRDAQIVSVAGGLISLLMAVPPVLLGISATAADWNQTTYGVNPLDVNDMASVMPLTIKHFTPKPVAIIALSAIVAAVMSSLDSIILSSSSMITHNIYKLSIRENTIPTVLRLANSSRTLSKAGETELKIVQVLSMLVITLVTTVLALTVDTIAGIFILTADIVYVVVFPQFCCAIFVPHANAYGSFFGFVIGVLLRFGGGEPSLSIDPFIEYPNYDAVYGQQLFPYKTMAMLVNLLSVLIFSYIFHALFTKGYIPEKYELTGKIMNSSNKVSGNKEVINEGYHHSNVSVVCSTADLVPEDRHTKF